MFSGPLEVLNKKLIDSEDFVEKLGEELGKIANLVEDTLQNGFDIIEGIIKTFNDVILNVPLLPNALKIDTGIVDNALDSVKGFSDFLFDIPQKITDKVGDMITWIRVLLVNTLGFVSRIHTVLDLFKLICFVGCGLFGFKFVASIMVFIGIKKVGFNSPL